jgi:hypothetical protein
VPETLRLGSASCSPKYLLGLSPAALDGKVHKLEVRAKRPGLKTRSRRSYVASAEGTTQ